MVTVGVFTHIMVNFEVFLSDDDLHLDFGDCRIVLPPEEIPPPQNPPLPSPQYIPTLPRPFFLRHSRLNVMSSSSSTTPSNASDSPPGHRSHSS